MRIPMEDWLRGCVYHDGRHGYVTLPCEEVLKIADFIERLRADRKTEKSSEKPNNCDTCKHNKLEWYSEVCDGCSKAHSNYEPKDEPQTETEIAKAVVHKMIDDAVIAEDAYPDLRQKMHDAVDEYEPQTDCAWK